MALAAPTIVLFFRSATPFCCGVWGSVLLDPLYRTILHELNGGILTPIVYSQHPNLLSYLVLHEILELSKPLKDL